MKYPRRIDIFKTIEDSRQEMVNLLGEFIANPAIAPESGGEGEEQKVAYLEKRLKDFGFPYIDQHHTLDDRVTSGYRPNLVVWLDGSSSMQRLILVVHTDVVPSWNIAEWNTDPFKMVERDG